MKSRIRFSVSKPPKMVYIIDRPVPAHEAEGCLSLARLFQFLQFSNTVPSSSESRLLMLAMDELFFRTIDMSFLATAASARLITLWYPMRLTARWGFPIYLGLVFSDRRRAASVKKLDSTHATLVALSAVNSPLGREARRLVASSSLRVREYNKTDDGKRLKLTTEQYMNQIFFWYRIFGEHVGAVITHAMLWCTLHSIFEGSALLHEVDVASSGGEPVNAAQAAVAAAAAHQPRKPGRGSKQQQQQQQKRATQSSMVWFCYSMNIRWLRWQIVELSSVTSDDEDETTTFACALALPMHDGRNDFIANELRKTGNVSFTGMWYPARLWWMVRMWFVPRGPSVPGTQLE